MSEEENTDKENFYFNEKNGKIVTTTTTATNQLMVKVLY